MEMDKWRKKIKLYGSILAGMIGVLLLLACGLLYLYVEESSESARYQGYVDGVASASLSDLDDAVLSVSEILDEVVGQRELDEEQKTALIEGFHKIKREAEKNQQLVGRMLRDDGEAPTLEQTARQAKKYCNHFRRQGPSEESGYNDTTTIEAEDFANHIEKVAVKEMDKEDVFIEWESKLRDYEEATYAFRDDYHFLDSSGFFEEEYNEQCG
ncbi:hypothetical protein SAMN04487936_11157 [Halobacillus dabanensis]|uniref:Uncharacterized protein n=1 Tax=Halobacillus dabanensis TaxID=240302 RepID=A0A1I3YKG5_HALDA|nr:hypothetical protein [Halobacillus dabanensis]SFK32253.1 hypothetical protein SAMN04487936_11157 [Halobacillus dabanensis]